MKFLENIPNYGWIAFAATVITTITVPFYLKNIKNLKDNFILFERIIDEENKIYIGIYENSQVIVFDYNKNNNSNKLYKLIKLTEKENQLEYEFENNIIMILEKKEYYYTINIKNMPNQKSLYKIINPIIIKYFTPIGISTVSYEFDKMYELFSASV